MTYKIKFLFLLIGIAILLSAFNVVFLIIAKQYIGAFGSFVMCWAILENARALQYLQKDDVQKEIAKNRELKLENIRRFAEIVKLREILKRICFKLNIVASSAEFNRLLHAADSEFIEAQIFKRIELHSSKQVSTEKSEGENANV